MVFALTSKPSNTLENISLTYSLERGLELDIASWTENS